MLVNEKICSKQFHISAWVSHIKNDYTSEKLKNLALIWFTSCCISSLNNICQTSSSAHFTSCHSWYFHAQITDATACPDMWFVKRQVLILFLWLILSFYLMYIVHLTKTSPYMSLNHLQDRFLWPVGCFWPMWTFQCCITPSVDNQSSNFMSFTTC